MTTHTRLFLPLLAAAALAACDGGTAIDQARVSIRLTDAPADVREAWVRIDRIYLQGGESTDSATAGQGGRVDLTNGRSEWVNLLTLSGGRTAELVSGATVPAGRYSELRFVVCEAYVVTNDGGVFASAGAQLPAGVASSAGRLNIPSACSSGVKVKFPSGDGAVNLENESALLIVDFDVSQSLVQQGRGPGHWTLHPVLRATAVGFAGGIAGTVATAPGVTLPACGGAAVPVTVFSPVAVAGTDSVSTIVGTDGRYRITAGAGTYAMGYRPTLGYTNGDTLNLAATVSAPSVTVTSGGTAAADYSITAATCKARAGA
jgi:hypothetical protein